ncbi:MAG: RcnB family protein [Gammaproteobacteria bacterium]
MDRKPGSITEQRDPAQRRYQWVRVNNDVVLAAIATGVVLDVLFSQF